jgi:hypothetical protein
MAARSASVFILVFSLSLEEVIYYPANKPLIGKLCHTLLSAAFCPAISHGSGTAAPAGLMHGARRDSRSCL